MVLQQVRWKQSLQVAQADSEMLLAALPVL